MTSDDSSFWLACLTEDEMGNTGDLNQLDGATYEVNEQPLLPNHDQINTLSPMPNESRKRTQELVSENLSEAKGNSTKKERPTSHIGELSASQQQPEPKRKDFEEIIKERSAAKIAKILDDRINRQIKNDKMDDMEAIIRSISDQNQIQWPLRPDVEEIKKKTEEIKSDCKKAVRRFSNSCLNSDITTMEVTLMGRLAEVKEEIENLKEQRRKGEMKTKNLDAIFTSKEGVSVETLREELSSALLCLRKTATNGPTTADKDQGSLRTLEQLQATFSSLKNEIYAMGNNKVDVSDFPGLKEALEKTAGWKTPNYLEPIAIRIEQARGKATEISLKGIQVLVCAAIQEMEDLPREKLNTVTLKKWGATLNKAKELGFQVEFAENLLEKNLYAYFASLLTQQMSDETQKKGSEIRGG